MGFKFILTGGVNRGRRLIFCTSGARLMVVMPGILLTFSPYFCLIFLQLQICVSLVFFGFCSEFGFDGWVNLLVDFLNILELVLNFLFFRFDLFFLFGFYFHLVLIFLGLFSLIILWVE